MESPQSSLFFRDEDLKWIAGISSKKKVPYSKSCFFINARIRKRLNQFLFDLPLHKKINLPLNSYIKITMKILLRTYRGLGAKCSFAGYNMPILYEGKCRT
jgi:hypothetical protein